MVVRDLVAMLSAFPPDLPVVATWEGTLNGLLAPGVSVEKWRDGRSVVLLDVEGNEPESRRVFEFDEWEDLA